MTSNACPTDRITPRRIRALQWCNGVVREVTASEAGFQRGFRDGKERRVRASYDNALRDERAARTHLLRRLAIDEIAVRTDRSYVEPLLRFFRRRSVRRRR